MRELRFGPAKAGPHFSVRRDRLEPAQYVGAGFSRPRTSMPHHVPIESSIDLHTFAPRDIKSVVEEYVTAAHEAGLREVRLIHGRGKGVQRGIVQQALERHPLVVEFWDADETHLGATVARLQD
jgi:DNA-nicking Smr family endonuclease